MPERRGATAPPDLGLHFGWRAEALLQLADISWHRVVIQVLVVVERIAARADFDAVHVACRGIPAAMHERAIGQGLDRLSWLVRVGHLLALGLLGWCTAAEARCRDDVFVCAKIQRRLRTGHRGHATW